jgi:hypothetical protein
MVTLVNTATRAEVEGAEAHPIPKIGDMVRIRGCRSPWKITSIAGDTLTIKKVFDPAKQASNEKENANANNKTGAENHQHKAASTEGTPEAGHPGVRRS